MNTQSLSVALVSFVWEGFPVKLNQPKKDARFFPLAAGHLRIGMVVPTTNFTSHVGRTKSQLDLFFGGGLHKLTSW